MVNKKNLSIALRFLISFGLVAVLIWIMRKDISNIRLILKDSDKIFFLLALAINIPITALLAYRLKLLLAGQKISMGIKDAVYLTLIGFFFNNFLPTAIGGDIAKAYYASKKTNNKIASYAAVLSDRLFGFLATMSVAMIGLVFIGRALNNNLLLYSVFFVFFISVIVTLFLFNKKIERRPSTGIGILHKTKEKIYKIYNAINMYRDHPFLLAKIILLSVFLQGCSIVSIYFFVLSIGGDLPLLKLFFVIPLVWAVSMLPSINGLGVREGAFVYFLKGDIGSERAFAISLLWLGVIIIYSIAGGILHLIYPVKVRIGEDMEI